MAHGTWHMARRRQISTSPAGGEVPEVNKLFRTRRNKNTGVLSPLALVLWVMLALVPFRNDCFVVAIRQ